MVIYLCVVVLNGGQAVCNAAPGLFPGPGTYLVAAWYSGNDNIYSSQSTQITQTETP
jgi:hypothetical protein